MSVRMPFSELLVYLVDTAADKATLGSPRNVYSVQKKKELR